MTERPRRQTPNPERRARRTLDRFGIRLTLPALETAPLEASPGMAEGRRTAIVRIEFRIPISPG